MVTYSIKACCFNGIYNCGNLVKLCKMYNKIESFENLFFDCQFAFKMKSIFLGISLGCDNREGFNWDEILFGYVKSFSAEFNKFRFLLASEVLWHIWKARNDKLLQGKKIS